jgi:hypothetical protein
MMGSLPGHMNVTVNNALAVWGMLSVDRRGRQKIIEGGLIRTRTGQTIKQEKNGFVRKENSLLKSSKGNRRLSNTKRHNV